MKDWLLNNWFEIIAVIVASSTIPAVIKTLQQIIAVLRKKRFEKVLAKITKDNDVNFLVEPTGLAKTVEDATKKEIASVESARDAEIHRLKEELKNRDENQTRAKRIFDQLIKRAEDNANKKIQQIESEKEEFLKNLEIQSIQTENLKGSKGYFKLSKFHAWFSFGFSIAACSLGLVLVSVAAYYAIAEQNYDLMIAPGIGAALANFIAATVFWVHNKSARQLNRYYDSLHEIEVFLSSTKIIEKIASEEKRDAAYTKVIDELFNIQKIKAAKPEKYVPPDKVEKKSEETPSAPKPNSKEG